MTSRRGGHKARFHTSLQAHLPASSGGTARHNDDDDGDETVATLQTLRTTRTARTSRTAATSASKKAEIDALFDDLLGDGDGGGRKSQQHSGADRDGNDDEDDIMRDMHRGSGESVVSGMSGLPSISVPAVPANAGAGGTAANRRRPQSAGKPDFEEDVLFGDDDFDNDNDDDDDDDNSKANKYSKSGAAGTAGSIFASGLNAIGQYAGSAGSTYGRSKKNDDEQQSTVDRYADGYKSSYTTKNRMAAGRRQTAVSSSSSFFGDQSAGSGQSVVTHGVSSILEEMGLGDRRDGLRNRPAPGELDGFLSNQRDVAQGNANINGAFAPSTFPFARQNHRNRSQSEKMVHLRAGMIMFSLIGLVYSAVQLSVVVKHERGSRGGAYTRIGGRIRALPDGADTLHDEGMDRPMSEQALNNLRARSSSNRIGTGMNTGLASDSAGGASGAVKDIAASDGPVDALPGSAMLLDQSDPGVTAMVKENMPFQYDYLADLSTRYTKEGAEAFMKETPIFWHVPRSGGRLIIDVMSRCHNQKYHVVTQDNFDESEKVLKDPDNENVFVSALLHTTIELLDMDHYGRAFTLLRHPIERAASVYSNLHESHKDISKMTFEEYAKSKYAENNWMVRYLSGKSSGEVTNDHLTVAKEVLRKKFVVGLLEQKEESAKRIQHFFAPKWDPNGEGDEGCRRMVINAVTSRSEVKEGGQAWNLLVWQNKLDMKLYSYAQELFAKQGQQLFGGESASAQSAGNVVKREKN